MLHSAWKYEICSWVWLNKVDNKRRYTIINNYSKHRIYLVTGSRPSLATRHIRCVLLVIGPNKLNLLSWLLIYLCNPKTIIYILCTYVFWTVK